MRNNINYQILSVEEQELWSLTEVKNYLRVAHKNDDKLIASLISSAIISAEQFLGISFFIKKVSLVTDDDEEDITEGFGYVDFNNQKIWIAQKYLYKNLVINYEAGLGEKIPRTILHGILMHIGMMYDFGENLVNISSEIKEIYLPYRALKI